MTSATTLFAGPFVNSISTPAFTLEFDAAQTIAYAGSTDPTEHPVEDGGEITDHSINRSDELELRGIIANSPIVFLGTANALPSVPGGSPRTRAQDAFDAIVATRKAATLVSVSTEWRDYEDMQIISESVTRDVSNGDILDISIRLKQFRRATVEAEDVVQDPKDLAHKSESKNGRKQLEEAEPEVEAKANSVLSDLFGIGGP